ncbi:hypothetical protein NSTC745_02062 [Nostoc sp. DSM 114161]
MITQLMKLFLVIILLANRALGIGQAGGVGGVGGWGRNLSPLSPHTPHTSLSPLPPAPCPSAPCLPMPHAQINFLLNYGNHKS